jgi:putative transposase
MDFELDRDATRRTIQCLTVVDDATHEAVTIVVERNIGGDHLTRILDQLCAFRGHPAVIRTDTGKKLTGYAMLNWTHRNNVALRLIEPGKPTQSAYIESFNRRLQDECLNDHWFISLAHARVVIEAWRREYNDDRPKRALGGLTPSPYARQLAATAVTLTLDSKAARY